MNYDNMTLWISTIELKFYLQSVYMTITLFQYKKEMKEPVITNGDITDNTTNRPDNEKFQKMLEDIALKKQQEETALLSRETIRLIRVRAHFRS